MKIVTFKDEVGNGWGVLTDNRTIMDLREHWPSVSLALAAGLSAIKQARGPERPISSIQQWSNLVQRDSRIFCVGVNYGAHAIESGREVPEWPSIFLRHADSFVGHQCNVIKPSVTESFDYEAELAVFIGQSGRSINEKDAMKHVAGYTCLAENSARDFQRHSRQVTAGKNFDRSGAIGPYLITSDEIEDVNSLEVRGILNGNIMQQGAVSDLIYSIPTIISYISKFTTLRPGDLISTGTPQGVGASQKPPRFLNHNDKFDVVIEGVGTLSNTIIDEGIPHV